MQSSKIGFKLSAILVAGGLLTSLLGPVRSLAAGFGRLAGVVSDDRGNPLMGASVLVMGPLLISTASTGDAVERVITDAKGKFAIGNLVPGWYALQIISPTRLPAHRNGIKVEAGQTSSLKFVLGDAFAPLRFQIPASGGGSLGDDWKWVLRTSAATRPILRYRQQAAASTSQTGEHAQPVKRHLVGVAPRSSSSDPTAADSGMESVVAYLRALSPGSDLLAIGSAAADGTLATSVGAVYRKAFDTGDSEEFSLVVHQLGYALGATTPGVGGQLSDSSARGLAASSTHTFLLNPRLTLTVGADIDYLNATRDVLIAQPRIKLAYRLDGSTDLAFVVGRESSDGLETPLDRINSVNSFPLVTLRAYRPEIEQLNHSEVSYDRRVQGSGRLEIAAFHDGIDNAAVWASGHPASAGWLAGNYLINPAVNGVFVNVGDYRSNGYHVAYEQRLGSHVDALVAYIDGDALSAQSTINRSPGGDLQGALKLVRCPALAGKVSARIPVTKTKVTSSYEWVGRRVVTMADPRGQADLQVSPYLDFQVRQPIPPLAFLPVHIEAIADFRDCLSQGHSPVTQSGESTLLLGSTYKSIRGGFSVEF